MTLDCPACRFGRFELQPSQRRLLVDGQPTTLGARAFDLLLVLVARAGQLVSKRDLLDLVWPGLVVEENNLQVQMCALRKLLGPQVIATIPGRGYRFTAALGGTQDEAAAIAPGGSPAAGGASTPATPLTNLPQELPTLYGRDADLVALHALLEAHRLVTVVGAGGIGKSRLAQAAAQAWAGHWPDGAWMVEMAGLSDPERLPNAVAQVLNIKTPGPGAALDELVSGVAQRQMLLVLDNCEHVLDAAAELAQAILLGAPHVKMLTTSQEPLRLPAEQQYRVVPLAVPADSVLGDARQFGAVALFEARVRAADPRFALNDESLPLVIDVCRRLDGLPLAIELAAARVATLGLRPVRDKLDARFKLLTGGSRATLRRHQTLRAALEWSHHLLNDAERTAFRRLGVLAGGFTIELAQAVASDPQLDEWAVLDHLSALVDKSLVVADAGDAPRYRLLESARAFALEQLAAADETAEVLRRHALAMRDFLKRVDDANLEGELRTDQYAALVVPELDNLRNAYAWAIAEGGDLAVAIALAAHSGSLVDYASECVDWIASLRQHVEDSAADDEVTARYWRAICAGNMMGHAPRPLQLEAAKRAVTLYRRLGKPRRVVSSLLQVSRLHSVQGDFAQAQGSLDEARALIRPDWPAEFRIIVLRRDGSLARDAGRFPAALALYRDTLRASAATGDWRLEVIARHNLGDLLWEMGPIEEAARVVSELAESLRARPAAENDMDMLYANLMGIKSEMGRVDAASAAAATALPLIRRSRRYFTAEWAYLFWRRGQLEAAATLIGATDAETVRSDAPPQPNEARLLAQARPALEAALAPDVFARCLAEGAALDPPALLALLAATLAAPSRRERRSE